MRERVIKISGSILCLLALTFIFLEGCEQRQNEEYIIIARNSPFFVKPDVKSGFLGVNIKEKAFKVYDVRRQYFNKTPGVKRKWIPMMCYADFYKVMLDGHGQQYAWVSQDLICDPVRKIILPRTLPQQKYKYWIVLVIGILLLILYLGIKLIFYRTKERKNIDIQENVSSKLVILGLSFIVFLRYFLLLSVLFFAGKIMIHPTDEYDYFHIAKDILQGHISNIWEHTIGLSLVYIPFIYIFKINDIYTLCSFFSFFFAFIISPASLIFVFFILRKLKVSNIRAFVVVFLWAVLPFCYFPLELHSPKGNFIFKSFFALPDFTPVSYRVYYIYNWVGFNAASDTVSTFFVLLTFLLILYLRPNVKSLCFVSGLFAFSCLIRINNIFFAFLIAYLFWDIYRDKFIVSETPSSVSHSTFTLNLVKLRYKTVFLYAFLSIVSFLVVFSPQLFINRHFFSSFFTFPYVLHPNRAAQGFAFDTLYSGLHFIIGCNYIFFSCGLLGLFTINNKKLRIILTLWALPLAIFFMGYPEVGGSPIRFILTIYPALIAMIVCSKIWDLSFDNMGEGNIIPKNKAVTETYIEKAGFFFIICLHCLLISPCFRLKETLPFDLNLLPYGKDVVILLNIGVILFSLLLLFYLGRKKSIKSVNQNYIFMLVFIVLYNIGAPVIFFAISLYALAYSLYIWAKEFHNTI